jgi:YihY family inner membrane protein
MVYRRRYRAFDVFAETMDGWRRHLSGRNASLLAFFSFLSIFPLMLAAVSILGFVLSGNPDLRIKIVDSAAAEIPVLGPQLAENTDAIDGSLPAIVIGLAIALWSSTKAFVGLQSALDDTWEVGVDDRAGMAAQRGKALFGLAIIAVSQGASLVIASIISAARLPAFGNIALLAATVIVNIIAIAAMFRFLTSYTATWRDVWTGAVFAGVILTILQNLGTTLVRRSVEGDNEAIKTINTVLGLITWLGLIGITVLMCAELNAARKRLREHDGVDRRPHMSIPIRT